MPCRPPRSPCFFFFNDTATTEIYTLSLHDALPISSACHSCSWDLPEISIVLSSPPDGGSVLDRDQKSTRLNSSHSQISYAVFCLKKIKTRSLWCGCCTLDISRRLLMRDPAQ